MRIVFSHAEASNGPDLIDWPPSPGAYPQSSEYILPPHLLPAILLIDPSGRGEVFHGGSDAMTVSFGPDQEPW